jgi:hypothetical protein
VCHCRGGRTDLCCSRDIAPVFQRRSRLTMRSKYRYWGYRFLALVIHYAEDACLPYHSEALPQADYIYYLRYFASTDTPGMRREATRLAENRHYPLEDFAAQQLQQPYLENGSGAEGLARRLSNHNRTWGDVHDADRLLSKTTSLESRNEKDLDKNGRSAGRQKWSIRNTISNWTGISTALW